jgi:hypothetical protein
MSTRFCALFFFLLQEQLILSPLLQRHQPSFIVVISSSLSQMSARCRALQLYIAGAAHLDSAPATTSAAKPCRDLVVDIADVSALPRVLITYCRSSSPCLRSCHDISCHAVAVISSSLSLMSARCRAL